jgi:hypothetical protein
MLRVRVTRAPKHVAVARRRAAHMHARCLRAAGGFVLRCWAALSAARLSRVGRHHARAPRLRACMSSVATSHVSSRAFVSRVPCSCRRMRQPRRPASGIFGNRLSRSPSRRCRKGYTPTRESSGRWASSCCGTIAVRTLARWLQPAVARHAMPMREGGWPPLVWSGNAAATTAQRAPHGRAMA